jgi:hypothetical protein
MKPFHTRVIQVAYEWRPAERWRTDRTRIVAVVLYPPAVKYMTTFGWPAPFWRTLNTPKGMYVKPDVKRWGLPLFVSGLLLQPT